MPSPPFGGVPGEVLYDNAKTVVLKRNAYGSVCTLPSGLPRLRPTHGLPASALLCFFRESRQARRPIFTSLPAKGDGPEPRIGVEPARQSAVDLKKRLLPRVSFPVRSAGSIVGGVIICLH